MVEAIIQGTVGTLILVLLGIAIKHSGKAAHELAENSGSTVRDKIERLSERQTTADKRMERIEGKVDRLTQEVREVRRDGGNDYV